MTAKAFRTLALSLPEAHEAPHFERASFRVGKKIFATLTADGAEAPTPTPSSATAVGPSATAPSA